MNAEDLIAEVAKRRGVVLTVADPAIIVATVLELNLEQATKEIGTSGPGPVQIRRWRRRGPGRRRQGCRPRRSSRRPGTGLPSRPARR